MQAGKVFLRKPEDEIKSLLNQCGGSSNILRGKLSPKEIAQETGYQQSDIEKIESGELDPPLSMMLKILLAQGLALSVKPAQAIDIVTAREIGKFIAEKRKKEGLTEEELAEKMKIAAADVVLWEKWADDENTGELYLISTAIAPPPKALRQELMKKHTGEEIDKAYQIGLEALELLGVISCSPLLPSPKVMDAVEQFLNQN